MIAVTLPPSILLIINTSHQIVTIILIVPIILDHNKVANQTIFRHTKVV